MKRPIPLVALLSVMLPAATSALAWFGPAGKLTSTLLAGQTTDVGRIDRANTKGSFKVATTTRGWWFISASHPDKRR